MGIFIPIIHQGIIPQLRTVPTTAHTHTHTLGQLRLHSLEELLVILMVNSFKIVFIYNCLNHGPITHNDTTSGELNNGGIAGTLRK